MTNATPCRLGLLLALVIAVSCSTSPPQKGTVTDESDDPAGAPETPPATPAQTAVATSAPTSKDEPESVDGYRLVRAKTKDGQDTSIAIKAPAGWQVIQPPNTPDPHGGKFTLPEATQGLPAQGTLAARIKTNMGSFYCDLFADKAPNTVANFVGLARGRRKFWDEQKLAWVARPHFDGTTFHRVIPDFMIQGGDYMGTGAGRIGYMIPDEMDPSLHHDRAGQLCMANRGPNTNEGQFFITDAAAPHLEGTYTIFGQCEPTTLVQRIARVPQSGAPKNEPLTPVVMEKIEIKRVVGGIAKWMPASAKLPSLHGVVPVGKAVQVPTP